MAVIDSSTLVRYNANSRGTSTGDCSVRAISLAFNIDYRQAKKELNSSKGLGKYNSHTNCVSVIKKLGGGDMIRLEEKTKVGDFADSHTGTYIVWCSKDGTVRSLNHLVCVINDRIYDSWDSRKYFVLGYWNINNGIRVADINDDIQLYLKHHLIEGRNTAWYQNYVSDIFDKIIDKNRKLKKLANTYDYDIQFILEVKSASLYSYNFALFYKIEVNFGNERIPTQKFNGKVAFTFKPTMTTDEADEFFDKTFYSKFYFLVHNMVDKIEDICNGDALIGDADYSNSYNPNRGDITYYMSAKEEKIFRALPYWAQKIATRFNVDDGRYYYPDERVRLSMYRPPFDLEYDANKNNDIVRFKSPDVGQLKKALKHYRDTGNFDQAYDIASDYY